MGATEKKKPQSVGRKYQADNKKIKKAKEKVTSSPSYIEASKAFKGYESSISSLASNTALSKKDKKTEKERLSKLKEEEEVKLKHLVDTNPLVKPHLDILKEKKDKAGENNTEERSKSYRLRPNASQAFYLRYTFLFFNFCIILLFLNQYK